MQPIPKHKQPFYQICKGELSSCGVVAQSEPDNKELSDIINNIAKDIFKNKEEIIASRRLLRQTATELMQGVEKGFGKNIIDCDFHSPDYESLKQITDNVYHFSAAKNYNQLREMTDALRDGDRIRSFNEFADEVQRINAAYNERWLRTEYNQAIAASQAAARWNEFAENAKTMPFLKYEAVMDGNTRPEHAALNGIVKRIDDAFWNIYYPPNGWGCRCEAVQLPGSTAKETPDADIHAPVIPNNFKINFGKQKIVFPPQHAYYIDMPKQVWQKIDDAIKADVKKYYYDKVINWADVNLPKVNIRKAKAQRLILTCASTKEKLIVNKPFFKETFAKNIHGETLPETMILSTKIKKWLPKAKFIKTEKGIHHNCDFNVYEATYNGAKIEFKARVTAEEIIAHTMKLIK